MRRALAAAELTCLRMAFGRIPADIGFSTEEHTDATVRLKLLGATKVLRQDEAARCAALLHGAMDVTQIASRASNQLPGAEERSMLARGRGLDSAIASQGAARRRGSLERSPSSQGRRFWLATCD